jgi:hypothetical protein
MGFRFAKCLSGESDREMVESLIWKSYDLRCDELGSTRFWLDEEMEANYGTSEGFGVAGDPLR